MRMPVFPEAPLPARRGVPRELVRARLGASARPTTARTSCRSTRDARSPRRAYPETVRDARPLDRCDGAGPRNPLDPRRAVRRVRRGGARPRRARSSPVATILLTNRECPWRCLMCDLWQNTLEEDTRARARSRGRSETALARLPLAAPPRQALQRRQLLRPAGDSSRRRRRDRRGWSPFERVIVESHPALVGAPLPASSPRRLGGRLEVAMGLETVHPEVLPRLNKGMTLDDFRRAADAPARRRRSRCAPSCSSACPWVPAREQRGVGACASVDFAFDCGAPAPSR